MRHLISVTTGALLLVAATAACSDKKDGSPSAAETGASGAPSAGPAPDTAPPGPTDPATASPTAADRESTGPSTAPGPTKSAKPSPSADKPRTTAPASAGEKFQGTWYIPVRGKGGALGVLTVKGTAVTLNAGDAKCTGSISTSASATMTCPGVSAQGKALVSADGKRLTFDWTEGESDTFVRTKPA